MEESTLDRLNSLNGLKQKIQPHKNIQIFNDTRGTKKSGLAKYKEAIKELTDLITLFPKDTNLYFKRATLRVHIGDIQGARADFRMSENYDRDTNYEFKGFPLV